MRIVVAGLMLLLAASVPDAASRQGRAGGRGAPPRVRKAILAWADTRNGQAQHAFTSHALALIERLGYESGLWDTYIRTDSHIIFNQAQKTDGTPASGGLNSARCWARPTAGTSTPDPAG